MSIPPLISIQPTGSFIVKYIVNLLTEHPLDPKQRLTQDPEIDMADYIVIATDNHIDIIVNGQRKVTLHLPLVIGTGMTGETARMAKMIYRGTYFHVKDDQSCVSVIHAIDVANAVRLAMTSSSMEGDYDISDGVDPTRHDLAEAIAYRLGQKRIYSLTHGRFKRMARWADRLGLSSFDSQQLRLLTTDARIDTSRWQQAAGSSWHPTSTVEYLRTHVYDQNSL